MNRFRKINNKNWRKKKMIDEKKLLEELKRNDLEFMQQSDLMDCLEDIISRQPKTNAWIPCSERLPTEEEYLKDDGRFILDDGNSRYQGLFDIYEQRFKKLKQWYNVYGEQYQLVEDNCVIAWQPLPERYKN